jgi:hypothetical protein
MDEVGVCLLRILERVLRNLRRRRCGSMVGRDGRNLLRVKKRCVDSVSSAPPRAKYLLLLILRERIHSSTRGWLMIARQRGAAPVESRNNVEAGQKEKKVTGSLAGLRRSSNEVTINFGSRPASGATAARPSPKFKSRLRPNFKLTIPSYHSTATICACATSRALLLPNPRTIYHTSFKLLYLSLLITTFLSFTKIHFPAALGS